MSVRRASATSKAMATTSSRGGSQAFVSAVLGEMRTFQDYLRVGVRNLKKELRDGFESVNREQESAKSTSSRIGEAVVKVSADVEDLTNIVSKMESGLRRVMGQVDDISRDLGGVLGKMNESAQDGKDCVRVAAGFNGDS